MLLFVDNIFRFTQAGSEVSALLGRIPWAVGYQPTLATEMGELQERITSTTKGSITSVQAIYVPADDLTDPAPATSFAHLDATTVLRRAITEQGIYPAVDPLDSTSRILDPPSSARSTTRSPATCSASCSATRRCRTSSPSSAWTSSPKRTSSPSPARARSSASFAAVPRRRGVHRPAGLHVPLEDTIRSFKALVDGKYDHLPEAAFYMVGTIDDAVKKAERWRRRPPEYGRQAALLSGRPERSSSGGEATTVHIPGSSGDFTVMANHAPFLTTLRPGVIRVITGAVRRSSSW